MKKPYRVWRVYKKEGTIKCSFFHWYVVLGIKIWVEEMIWRIFKIEVHF